MKHIYLITWFSTTSELLT